MNGLELACKNLDLAVKHLVAADIDIAAHVNAGPLTLEESMRVQDFVTRVKEAIRQIEEKLTQ